MPPTTEALWGWLGGLGGAVAIGVAVYREWRRERRREGSERRRTADATPAIIQALARQGTPMPALAVDAQNDVLRKLELVAVDTKLIAADVKAIRETQERVIREEKIREDALREGEARARGRTI